MASTKGQTTEKAVLKNKTAEEAHQRDINIQERDLPEDWKVDEAVRDAIREALQGKNVEVTFPTKDTYQLNKGGKTDSGNLTTSISTIVQNADRL